MTLRATLATVGFVAACLFFAAGLWAGRGKPLRDASTDFLLASIALVLLTLYLTRTQ